MSEWEPFDFAVTHVKRTDEGTIQALRGRVVEEGVVRDVPIELPVAKAVEYLGFEGRFCVAHEDDGALEQGPEIILDESDPASLTTEADAETNLEDLPDHE